MAEFRLAFLTMVWRDYWLLEKWIAHNVRLVGKRDLFVINHGGDPRVDEIANGCNVIHVPRDGVSIDLTRQRSHRLCERLIDALFRVGQGDAVGQQSTAGPQRQLRQQQPEQQLAPQ